jgi:hypothetical protein
MRVYAGCLSFASKPDKGKEIDCQHLNATAKLGPIPKATGGVVKRNRNPERQWIRLVHQTKPYIGPNPTLDQIPHWTKPYIRLNPTPHRFIQHCPELLLEGDALKLRPVV